MKTLIFCSTMHKFGRCCPKKAEKPLAASVFCFQFSVSICALGSAHMKDPWAGARELKASKANSREVYTSEAAAEGGKSSA